MTVMRNAILGILALGLFASLGGSANAADLYPSRSYGWRSQVWYGADCCRTPNGPGIRVVEQVPYCGDCDNLIGRPTGPGVRLRYIGYLRWTRGCAMGGCYGNYGDYGGCYWREVPVADGRGGWARGVERICD
jgi:hypothetical protein